MSTIVAGTFVQTEFVKKIMAINKRLTSIIKISKHNSKDARVKPERVKPLVADGIYAHQP